MSSLFSMSNVLFALSKREYINYTVIKRMIRMEYFSVSKSVLLIG